MTTVAANRDYMAADSFISDGARSTKILKAPGLVVGFAGGTFYGLRLAKWVIDGMRGAPPAPGDSDNREETEVLVLRATGLSYVTAEGTELPLDDDYAAIGSGNECALGSMWRDMRDGRKPDPALAVEAAAYHDLGTKLPVNIVYLNRRKRQ